LGNAHYRAVAAGLLALRAGHPLPGALPVTVLAAPDSPDGTDRWTARQRALAAALGARFTLVRGAGHLMMLDRPGAIAEAVLHPPGR
ncbi:alpha/beta fold hydrolase, partial [Streptomyces sp. Act-28]